MATGDWLIFIDADSHPSRELFDDVADAIATGRYLAGGSTVRLDERHFALAALTAIWNVISLVKKWAPGSFIFCEANAFRAIGGFSEELFASEELDLFRRFHKLARERKKRIVILRRHPLVTSARKAHLYSQGEHLRFLLKTGFSFGRTLKSAKRREKIILNSKDRAKLLRLAPVLPGSTVLKLIFKAVQQHRTALHDATAQTIAFSIASGAR